MNRTRWDSLPDGCREGLIAAIGVGPAGGSAAAIAVRLAAMDRALAAKDQLIRATNGTTTDWRMLAAIGIRESLFRNISEVGGGKGVGIFQIDIGQTRRVSKGQASSLSWGATCAAKKLDMNYNSLAGRFPELNPQQLLQATAASYNLGLGGISGNPATIDAGSTHEDYGSNVLDLMKCFNP